MKYIEEPIIKEKSDFLKDDITQEDFQSILEEIEKKSNHYNGLTSFKKIQNKLSYFFNKVKSFKSFKISILNSKNIENKDFFQNYKFEDKLKYKEQNLSHHALSIEQFLIFYKNKENKNLEVYVELLKNYGIPDISNPFPLYSDSYYKYHQDFLFCEELEDLFGFFIKDKIRQKEIAQHYDYYKSNLPYIDKISYLKKEIDSLKEKMALNKKALEEFFEEKIENKDKIENDLFSKYDEENKKNLELYTKLTQEHNELIDEFKDLIYIEEDYDYFLNLLNSANLGLLTLFKGDMFLENTLNLINLENLRFYYLFSILLSEENVWLKYSINKENLWQNIDLINKKSKCNIIPKAIFENIYKVREEKMFNSIDREKNVNYYQSIIQDFDLEIWSLKFDLSESYRKTLS